MFVGLASDISCTTNLTKMLSLHKLYEFSVLIWNPPEQIMNSNFILDLPKLIVINFLFCRG